VRVLVAIRPAGSPICSRACWRKCSRVVGQTVLVENRSGATGMIAADLVAKAAPDGYTLLVSPQSSLAIAPSMYAKLPYDPLRDFAPITEIARRRCC